MIKDAMCQFHKKCKLKRNCDGCLIPTAASEYEHEHATKMNYAKDADFRGIEWMHETYGDLMKRPASMDWTPLSDEEDEDDQLAAS